jgi:hypothetical protein
MIFHAVTLATRRLVKIFFAAAGAPFAKALFWDWSVYEMPGFPTCWMPVAGEQGGAGTSRESAGTRRSCLPLRHVYLSMAIGLYPMVGFFRTGFIHTFRLSSATTCFTINFLFPGCLWLGPRMLQTPAVNIWINTVISQLSPASRAGNLSALEFRWGAPPAWCDQAVVDGKCGNRAPVLHASSAQCQPDANSWRKQPPGKMR